MPVEFSDKVVKSARRRICDDCGLPIFRDSRYVLFKYLDEGTFSTLEFCMPCSVQHSLDMRAFHADYYPTHATLED